MDFLACYLAFHFERDGGIMILTLCEVEPFSSTIESRI